MKLILSFLTIGIIAALYLTPGKVEGEVFIVTQGGSSYKLALVDVRFVTKEIFSIHVKGKRAALSDCLTAKQINERISTTNVDSAELNKIYSTRERCQIDAIMSNLGPIKSSGKTNSDGKYDASVPRFKTLIAIASAERALPLGDSERYLWITSVNLGASFNQKVNLTNDNLVAPAYFDQMLIEVLKD